MEAGTVTASRPPRGGKSENESGAYEKRGIKQGAARDSFSHQPGRSHAESTTRSLTREYIRVCQNPLRDLRGWMDASDGNSGNSSRLFARSSAGLVRNDALRPLRGKGAEPRSAGRSRSSGQTQAAGQPKQARLSAPRRTTRQLAAAYVRLCQRPARDLSGWLALDDQPRRAALPGAFRQAAKQKTARGRPRATAAPAGNGRGAAAYAAELANWQPLIDAAATDPSLSREQRAAAVAALRVRQQIAAAAVRQRVTEEERQTAKAQRRLQSQQLRSFRPPDLTP